MSKYHYVYRITNTQEKKHYYGVRSSKVVPKLDLGIKYFSSSTDKEFINEQKVNKDVFKYKIIKQFESREEAINLEIKLHDKFDVGKNTLFYNKSKQTSSGFTAPSKPHKEKTKELIRLKAIGRVSGFKNKSHSEETKDLIRCIAKQNYILGKHGLIPGWSGHSHSEETKLIIGNANRGDNNYWRNNKMTEEHKLKNSIANSKIIKTTEWNRKNSESRTGSKLMNNGLITSYIRKECIESKLDEGWVYGKIKPS